MSVGPNKIVRTKKQVIEKQLLAALDDKTKVALLMDEKDLDLLIIALDFFGVKGPGLDATIAAKEMSKSLEQLRKEAFGK